MDDYDYEYEYDKNKYYEYLEAKHEAEEMDKWVEERDAERNKVLATLTKEERAVLDDLNQKQTNAFKVMVKHNDSDSIDAYDEAQAAYQRAAAKWPVLMDGYD